MRPRLIEQVLHSVGDFRILPALNLGLAAALGGCISDSGTKEARFVGKWQSSRLSTPLVMHANGEWEVLREDGSIIQFGVWQYADDTIIWSFRQGGGVGHDANKVLSVKPGEFRVRESDGAATVFSRLD